MPEQRLRTDMCPWTAADSAQLTAALVMVDGHHMPLTGDDRAAAVQLGTRLGYDVPTIAARLHLTTEALRAWAARNRIALPDPAGQPWWVAYAAPSCGSAGRRRRKRTTTSPDATRRR